MINNIKGILIVLMIAFTHSNCTGQKSTEYREQPRELGKVLIPFLPGSCHQCNDGFYKNLSILDGRKVDYSFVMPENYSDDLDDIKKEYRLEHYTNQQFIFSSALFDKYHIYEQAFVLQFGLDSNYKIYNNANTLVNDLEQLNHVETLNLGNYKIKKSLEGLLVQNKEQLYFLNSVQTNAFDYLDLKNKKQALKISFTDQHLFQNYLLNFKDPAIAQSKLKEVQKVTDLPKKDVFDHFEFVNDSLFASSNHTYVASLKDSVLGGFFSINIYKDGIYLGARSINNEKLPAGYSVIPTFHVYNNEMYIEVVKNQLETDKPNYFLAQFELNGNTYQFKKLLNFTVPQINKNVGYSFLDLKFSGRYFMTAISNILYDLETEQSLELNIPINKDFQFAHLINNCKGVDILVRDINAEYPNLLISYFSKDEKGMATNVILNYNMQNKNTVGKIQMPMDHSRYIKSDLSRFGYFLWMPEKDNNNYVVYKKLF